MLCGNFPFVLQDTFSYGRGGGTWELGRTKVVSLRHHSSLDSGDILTGIQTCIPKRMESRFLQTNSGSCKQFFVLVSFYEGG